MKMKYNYVINKAFPFFIVSILIVVLHLFFHPIRLLGMDTSIFYMDEKYTLASLFSTTCAFLIGFLYLSQLHDKNFLKKKLLNNALGFFFMILALDEFFEIHEYINTLIKEQLSNTSLLGQLSNISWVFPLMIIILAVISLFLLKIIAEKNKMVKKLLISGIFCFFFVLVFELIGSVTYGQEVFIYMVAVEEGLEMIGLCFFLSAVLTENHFNKPSR